MCKNTKLRFLLLFLLLVTLISGCGNNQKDIFQSESLETEKSDTEAASEPVTTESATPYCSLEQAPITDDMAVHFLDVGQGLSVFVQSGGRSLIYDGGDRSTSSYVVAYLKDQGITDIDYLISSHYDSDHLAGLIGCLNAFEVHNVIGSDYEHDRKLYSSFMNTVAAKGLEVQHPSVGTEYTFGNGKFTVFSPASIGTDSNANSVVVKLENGENSFLLTGDAEHNAESVMCSSGLVLESDVLSIAHHGSATATSYDFLKQVLPEYAVISCGQDNQYGHPDRDTMDKLYSMEIDVYRTDKQGTIIAISDGQKIEWSQEPCNDYSPGDTSDTGTQPQETVDSAPVIGESPIPEPEMKEDTSTGDTVWKSSTGSKYHSIPNCGNLNPDNATEITQNQAEAMGLGRCKNCL